MQTEESKKWQAEEALRALCIGMQVVGARWPAAFFIEIEAVPGAPGQPDLLLQVDSRFTVYPNLPEHFPDELEGLPELSLQDRVAALASLAQQKITDVRLGERYSHLILTFQSGAVLFVNGYHPLYESWTLSDTPNDGWTFVSTPGGGIAVWVPPLDEHSPVH